MEIILAPIVENFLRPIGDAWSRLVGRHVGFLSHYKQNLKNLEDEVTTLEAQRSNVERKVKEAEYRGEDIDDNVLGWLKDADETRQGVDKFRDEKTAKENMLCFTFSCPNIISRYRLSKEAVEKVLVEVKRRTEEGGEIGTVSRPKGVPPELFLRSSRDYESFQSREEVFKGIVKALKDPEVNIIGVYGTGGVGKTTMVSKIGILLKEDETFDKVVDAVVSQDADVRKIQGELAHCLDLKLSEETEKGRATELWHRLDNKKKNLIILDDVWRELDFKEIGIPIKDGSKSCKVLLTSRNRDVWKNMSVEHDFEIKFLSEEESWLIFNKKVEKHGDADDILARAICKECQGLPIAIIALGAALKGKDIHAWNDALYKLQNSMLMDIEGIDPKVYTSLKWSYDRLDSEDAKSCFLLCCLFPEGSSIPIDLLVTYYIGWRSFHRDQKPDSSEIALDRIHTVIGTLKRRCLLLDSIYGRNFVKMHDVVRDVAISIAKVDKSFLVKHGFIDWPDKASYENCSVISLRPKGMRRMPGELCCPKLDTLQLHYRANEFQLEVPDTFFNGMENLTVLYFFEVKLSPVLPTSIAKLAKLQMLCLDGCELGDITVVKYLRDHLEILSLADSSIKVLPPVVGELSLLRHLNMDKCKNLEVIPKGIISKLCWLEKLIMPSTFGNWEGATSGGGQDISIVNLNELMSLTRLTILHIFIPDGALLPEDFSFENLVTFRIAVGEIDDYSKHDYSTGALVLANIHLAITLGGLLGKPKRYMQRTGLYPSKSFKRLTRLSINNCRVKYLFSPSSVRGLVKLKELTIKRCVEMEGVIGNEGEEDEDMVISFSRLNELVLEDLPNFISFYLRKETTTTSSESSSVRTHTTIFTDKVAFPALELLHIVLVPKVTAIWYPKTIPIQERDTELSFNQLKWVTISGCENLINVVGGCPKIEAIILTEKQKGREVDSYVTCFLKLTSLILSELLNLESFCSRPRRCEAQPLFDHQVSFPALKELFIFSLPNISNIWDKKLGPIESFSLLVKLEVEHCNKLVNVVESTMLPQLRNLFKLSLRFCPTVEAIVNLEKIEEETQETDSNPIIPFPELSIIILWDLQNIKGFCTLRIEEQPVFHTQVAFPNLDLLFFFKLGEISLRQLLGACELNSKAKLCFCQCDEISTVVSPHLFRTLPNVGLLHVSQCDRVTEVFHFDGLEVGEGQECVGPSAQVRLVQLTYLPQLICLWNKDPHGLLDLKNLEYLTITCCPLLRNLMTASVAKALGGLRVLYLKSCSAMEEVIATEEGHEGVTDDDEIVFPKLQWLILKDLSNLKRFCNGSYNFQLPSLKTVVLKMCPNMQTFTFGSVRMPSTFFISRGNDGIVIEDLNKHLQQQHLEGEVEVDGDEMRDEGDKFSGSTVLLLI